MNFRECEIGWIYEDNKIVTFFGNKNSSIQKLQEFFPEIGFRRIKQIHSDICVNSTEDTVEADAHITNEKLKALVISTADCIPILMYCPSIDVIAAVHAGWRGVVNQITIKTINKIIEMGEESKDLRIWVGPHILQPSFEVNLDVMKLIRSSSKEDSDDVFRSLNEKYYINLHQVLKSQLETLNAKIEESLMHDTKTNLNLHSFRRDGLQSGRNLSFIYLK